MDNIVYLGTDLGIYISTNNGNTWDLLGKENIKIFSIQTDKFKNIYLTTSYGVYMSKDGGLIFADFSSGLDNRSLGKLFTSNNDYLYIGTDLGVYKTDYPFTTDITESNQISPNYFSLSHNYPNPFNPTTTFKYQVPELIFVTIKVYDVLGSEVATLVNEEKPAGSYEVEFDGSVLPSGIYFYQLSARNFIEAKKMVLMK